MRQRTTSTAKAILKWQEEKVAGTPCGTTLAAFSHLRLVEPFAAGWLWPLGLQPAEVLANDVNPHLINCTTGEGRPCHHHPMENDEKMYYRYRARFNELIRSGRSIPRRPRSCFTTSIGQGTMVCVGSTGRVSSTFPLADTKAINYAGLYPVPGAFRRAGGYRHGFCPFSPHQE